MEAVEEEVCGAMLKIDVAVGGVEEAVCAATAGEGVALELVEEDFSGAPAAADPCPKVVAPARAREEEVSLRVAISSIAPVPKAALASKTWSKPNV